MRAAILVPDVLEDAVVDSRPYAGLLSRTAELAGLEPVVISPDEPVDGSPLVVWSGRHPSVPAAALAALSRLGEGGAVLAGPAGDVLAALVEPAPGETLREALARAEGAAVITVSDAEARPIRDAWDLGQLSRALHAARVEALGRAGARFVDPARVVIEPDVIVEPGALVWPDVVLRGHTRISAGAEVQSGCWLVDTEVATGAVIKPHSVCEGARVGPGAKVGPMAHLRSGAVLEDDVKVGNFVEVKNTLLHRGAKASHLTYLGDSEVGAEANVGAGTITCNYDGHRKQRTVIGARAFIGSNTALVAPVEVGAGAIIGAGSVITRSVPDGGLALERAEQRTYEGRAALVHERNRRAAERERGDR